MTTRSNHGLPPLANRFGATRRTPHFEVEELEHLLEQLADVGVVVDDQYLLRAHEVPR